MLEYIIFVCLYVTLCILNVELILCDVNNKLINTAIKVTCRVIGTLSWILPCWIPYDLGMGLLEGILMYALQFAIAAVAIMIATHTRREAFLLSHSSNNNHNHKEQ